MPASTIPARKIPYHAVLALVLGVVLVFPLGASAVLADLLKPSPVQLKCAGDWLCEISDKAVHGGKQ